MYFIGVKTVLLICIISDDSAMLMQRCEMMPAVHPRAAKMLFLRPSVIPTDIVYITPVPGIKMIISEVIRNVYVFIFILFLKFLQSFTEDAPLDDGDSTKNLIGKGR